MVRKGAKILKMGTQTPEPQMDCAAFRGHMRRGCGIWGQRGGERIGKSAEEGAWAGQGAMTAQMREERDGKRNGQV